MYRYLSGRLRQLGIRQTDLAKAMGLSEASITVKNVPASAESATFLG